MPRLTVKSLKKVSDDLKRQKKNKKNQKDFVNLTVATSEFGAAEQRKKKIFCLHFSSAQKTIGARPLVDSNGVAERFQLFEMTPRGAPRSRRWHRRSKFVIGDTITHHVIHDLENLMTDGDDRFLVRGGFHPHVERLDTGLSCARPQGPLESASCADSDSLPRLPAAAFAAPHRAQGTCRPGCTDARHWESVPCRRRFRDEADRADPVDARNRVQRVSTARKGRCDGRFPR